MPRPSLPILTPLSALLALLCISLWLRSYIKHDYFEREAIRLSAGQAQTHLLQLSSHQGLFDINFIYRDDATPDSGYITTFFQSHPDGVQLYRLSTPSGSSPVTGLSAAGEAVRRLFLFGYSHSPSNLNPSVADRESATNLLLPHWLPSLLFLLLPLRWLKRKRRRSQRRRLGLCLACGYDLRATLETCPECGHTPQPLSQPNPRNAKPRT